MGGYFGKNGAGGGGGSSDLFKYDKERDRTISKSPLELQSNALFFGKDFGLSNGVNAIGAKLADNKNGLVLINRFDPANGSYSNPKFYSLGKSKQLDVNLNATVVMDSPINVNYTTNGNNLTYSFIIMPASAGRMRVQYWLGNDDTGSPVVDFNVDITQHQVDTSQQVVVKPNFYIIEGGTPLFVRFSGIKLKGNGTIPWFVSNILPYKEVTINGHVEHVKADMDVVIGCDYALDPLEVVKETPNVHWWFTFTSISERDIYYSNNPSEKFVDAWCSVDNQVTGDADYYKWNGAEWILYDPNQVLTLRVPTTFTDRFRAFDFRGQFSATAYALIDFTDFGQGIVTMNNPKDDIEFFYIKGAQGSSQHGWFLHDKVSNVR
ncbi:hypothetical protein, partial [Shewanella cutis]